MVKAACAMRAAAVATRRVAAMEKPRMDLRTVTTGQYDAIVTLDMPSGEAMIKFACAVAATGNVRTTTVRAFTTEEFSKLAAEAPSPRVVAKKR